MDRFCLFATPSTNSRFLRTPDGRSRRIAEVAVRGIGRLNWAESDNLPNGKKGRDSTGTEATPVGAESARTTLVEPHWIVATAESQRSLATA